jgi:anti-anti-sigma regulatory factor
LPITDNVLVMPIVGGVDAARAARVLEAALGGAAGWHAKVVIIDITGVKSAGAEVATGLIRTARALQLLGAEAIITGVRAEVARALVELGADLGTLVTKSTLKAGIAHAMRTRM